MAAPRPPKRVGSRGRVTGRNGPAEPPLTAQEQQAFQTMLLEKRRDLLGNVRSAHASVADDADSKVGLAESDMLESTCHLAELEVSAGLLRSERDLLREIDAALERLANGSYGFCEATGKPIGRARLQARPWARHCIDYARFLESRRPAPR